MIQKDPRAAVALGAAVLVKVALQHAAPPAAAFDDGVKATTPSNCPPPATMRAYSRGGGGAKSCGLAQSQAQVRAAGPTGGASGSPPADTFVANTASIIVLFLLLLLAVDASGAATNTSSGANAAGAGGGATTRTHSSLALLVPPTPTSCTENLAAPRPLEDSCRVSVPSAPSKGGPAGSA